MVDPLTDRVIRMIGQAAELYHRLVILVAPAGAGKTAALQDVHKRTDEPLLNVNLELSRRMLDLTERQRALQLPRLLSEMVNAAQADVVLLDNIEVLFDVSLKQDPLVRARSEQGRRPGEAAREVPAQGVRRLSILKAEAPEGLPP